MRLRYPQSKGRLFMWLMSLAALVALFLLLVMYSGLYNVAASSGHVVWVKKLLEVGMHRSVKTWSLGAPALPDNLETTARIQLGAAHFAGACSNCHGAPGTPLNAVHLSMLPPPPRLQNVAGTWTPQQLFRIVRHGIKYTGMPFWSGHDRDDEVWSVVAFLQQLPHMDEATYRRYAMGSSRQPDHTPASAAATGYEADLLTTCDRCHDTPDTAPASTLVPRLAGQREEYLFRSLLEYISDRRQSGIMEPIATQVGEDRFRELARYYANMTSPAHRGQTQMDKALFARGQTLAEHGDADNKIPACNACHTTGQRNSYPLLRAQSADYIAMQLTLWQQGGRAQTPSGQLMAVIAKRLSPQQIRASAIYFQRAPANHRGEASP